MNLYFTGFDAFGEILQPANKQQQTDSQQQQNLGQKDLDSSLALLAGNISINGAQSVKFVYLVKSVQYKKKLEY
jgi:hypothetical protein